MMRFSRRWTAAALAASVLALGACDGDSTGNDDGENEAKIGQVAFTYGGALSGSYDSRGEYDQDDDFDLQGGEFAVALRDVDPETGQPVISMTAFSERSSFIGDLLILAFPAVTQAATFDFDFTECLEAEFCPGGVLLWNLDVRTSDGGPDSRLFVLESGTIRVTAVTGGRVRGTFDAVATELSFEENPARVELNGGTFDVPLVDADDLPDFARSLPAPALSRLPVRQPAQ